jgi:hypothetical protein
MAEDQTKEEEACRNCRFFKLTDPHQKKGQCRRHAPVALQGAGKFPQVQFDDWCGEYERKT